jgi:hypothetical protein
MRVICHIGLPRAASTSIQSVLSDSKSINFIPWHRYKESNYVFSVLVTNARRNYYNHEYCLRVVNNLLENFSDHSKPLVLSWEGFMALPPNARVDFDEVLGRLQRLFDDEIEFVGIIREQWSFLRSIYSISLMEGVKCSFTEYLEYNTLRLEDSIIPHLNYAAMIREMRKIAPKSSLFVFEEMVQPLRHVHLLKALGVTDVQSMPHLNKRFTNLDRDQLHSGFYQGDGVSSQRHDLERISYFKRISDKGDLFNNIEKDLKIAWVKMLINKRIVVNRLNKTENSSPIPFSVDNKKLEDTWNEVLPNRWTVSGLI